MAEFEVFKLRPLGAFHFGAGGDGVEESSERCSSDTLYSALFAEALQWNPSLGSANADGSPPVPRYRVSSCFPYAGDALLFPLPRLAPARQAEPKPGQRKRTKNIRYISVSLLLRMLEGASLSELTPNADRTGPSRSYQEGAALIANEDNPGFQQTALWSIDRIDHVTVDRATDTSQYYAVGQVRFAPDCGLYVLAQAEDASAYSELLGLLTRLGHSGLGGRRSRGLGQFEAERVQPIELPQGGELSMLLSRYLPTRDELAARVLGPGAAYELTRIDGWLASSDPRVAAQQRKIVTLLAEGSIVRSVGGKAPVGQIVDVRPDGAAVPHPVWRNGLALSVGVTMLGAV